MVQTLAQYALIALAVYVLVVSLASAGVLVQREVRPAFAFPMFLYLVAGALLAALYLFS